MKYMYAVVSNFLISLIIVKIFKDQRKIQKSKIINKINNK
jgi:hypothetical protein